MKSLFFALIGLTAIAIVASVIRDAIVNRRPRPAGGGAGAGNANPQSWSNWFASFWTTHVATKESTILGVIAMTSGVLMILFLTPTEWRNAVLGSSWFWILVTTAVLYGVPVGRLFPDNEKNKKMARSVLRVIVAVILLGLAWSKSKDYLPSSVSTASAGGSLTAITSGVKNFFTPAPVALEWKGSLDIVAPVNGTIEVDLSKAKQAWNVSGNFPDPEGHFEMSSPDWPKPVKGGGGSQDPLPILGTSRRVSFRSLDKEPVSLTVSWR